MSLVSLEHAFGNPGPQFYISLELEGSQDMLKRDVLCFLLKDEERIRSLRLSVFDTTQFSIQI